MRHGGFGRVGAAISVQVVAGLLPVGFVLAVAAVIAEVPAAVHSGVSSADWAGEWQRVALSRAMMRDGPLLLLLDEPTAALDPLTEHALFERYAASAQDVGRRTGGITVLVSHRFSTVRMADLILVVDGGRIAESGDHDTLMARDGQAAAYH